MKIPKLPKKITSLASEISEKGSKMCDKHRKELEKAFLERIRHTKGEGWKLPKSVHRIPTPLRNPNDRFFTCSKHGWDALNSPCPDCAKGDAPRRCIKHQWWCSTKGCPDCEAGKP
jgi:hypothetical protein